MKDHPQFCQIFLILMLPVIATQAIVVQNNFRKLEPGQNTTGASLSLVYVLMTYNPLGRLALSSG